MMELVLIIISFILVIVGLLGCILPVLPGPPLAYVGLLLVHVTDKVDFSPAQLVCWLLLVVVLQVLDYLTASAQVEKGLATKTAGTQVVYVLSIDGKRTELKGTAFKTWCKNNGVEIIHKGGATGVKEKRTFSVVFDELKKKSNNIIC